MSAAARDNHLVSAGQWTAVFVSTNCAGAMRLGETTTGQQTSCLDLDLNDRRPLVVVSPEHVHERVQCHIRNRVGLQRELEGAVARMIV
jgi:hypothetical protein